MNSAGPTRTSADLADVVELLLDKGIVINADIAVSVGDTELLGIQIRAAVASFETAARYGLEFPEGTDTEKLQAAAERGRPKERRALSTPPGSGEDDPSVRGLSATPEGEEDDDAADEATDGVEEATDSIEEATDGVEEATDSAEGDESQDEQPQEATDDQD